MVEFVVRQCSLDLEDKALAKLSTDEVTPKRLRDMSSKTLQLITTTIEHMQSVSPTVEMKLQCCLFVN